MRRCAGPTQVHPRSMSTTCHCRQMRRCSCGHAEIHRFARQRGRGAEAARLVASASVGVLLPQLSLVFNDGTPLRGLISPQRGIITWSDKTMWGRNGTVRMACYAFICARMQFPVHSSAHGCTKQLCPILPTDPVALHELVALLHPCRYTGSHTTQMGEARACGAAVPAIGKLAHECADSVAAGRGRR